MCRILAGGGSRSENKFRNVELNLTKALSGSLKESENSSSTFEPVFQARAISCDRELTFSEYGKMIPSILKLEKPFENRKSQHAYLMLITGAVAISLAPIFVRFSDLDPVVSAFYRLFLAFPFFLVLPFLGLTPPARETARRSSVSLTDLAMMFVCGAMLAADLALWHISINWTSIANATLFNNCAPVILLAFGRLFLKERITRKMAISFALATMGMGLLMGGNFALSKDKLAGDMVAVSTAVFYAFYLLLVKSLRQRYPTFTIMLGTSFAAAACLFLVAMINGRELLPPDLEGWLIVLGLALICHVIGQSLIANALADLPVSVSSFGLLLQPVSATILAWALFHETLGQLQLLGGFLVLCGIVLSNRTSHGDRKA